LGMAAAILQQLLPYLLFMIFWVSHKG
ncbi:MAG: hypothetical protein RLY95_1949, partial [Pseudomonadota bacterium]